MQRIHDDIEIGIIHTLKKHDIYDFTSFLDQDSRFGQFVSCFSLLFQTSPTAIMEECAPSHLTQNLVQKLNKIHFSRVNPWAESVRHQV